MNQESRRPLLVFGDDGKPPADRAWSWIRAQDWDGWHLDLISADQDAEVDWGRPASGESWTPPWERELSGFSGRPDHAQLKFATDPRAMLADIEADLLVVGIESDTYLEALLTGSTTEWLLHHPPAPLVIARNDLPTRQVTACVDGSTHSLAALDSFAKLPLAAGSSVTLLAVSDGRVDLDDALAASAERLTGKVAQIDEVRLEGDATKAILDHLNDTGPDLVVLGTRGLTGWQRIRLGSTAGAVARAARCSSLVDYEEVR